MRIPLSVLFGATVLLGSAIAAAQPAPPPPPLPPPPPPAPPMVAPDAPPHLDASVRTDAPPPPPAPGAPSVMIDAPPPPPLPPAFPAETGGHAGDSGPALAGWHGAFYLRDAKDYFRIYPKLRINFDFNTYFGPGVSAVAAVDGGNALKTRFFLRRLEFELGGEFLKKWTFNGGFEITQPISNANGKTETAAGKAGADPTADSARFAAVQAPTPGIQAADVWINYTVAPWMNFMFGQYNAPFSMENRTSNKTTPFVERNVAIRGFVRPSNKEMGVTVWGELLDKQLNYEIGVFGGDGQNRPQVDGNVDVMGRIFVRPLSPSKEVTSKLQVGLSLYHGDRDPHYVGYDYSPITTGQGFALWNPTYKDSLGRQIHVVPSAGQNAIGGELRVPVSIFDLRGEAYYVSNHTREAVEGFQLTNTERLGKVTGVGWYAQVSMWPFGDAFVTGDPGLVRPTRIDFTKEPERPKKGLEVLLLVAGVNAAYDGGARGGSTYDSKTPGNPSGKTATDINVYQYGVGLNYWHTSYVRVSVDYSIYHTPGSGSTDNLAQVPGNLGKDPIKGANMIHELGTRLGIAF
ncbi:MAG: porin [Byssovorax sp.]